MDKEAEQFKVLLDRFIDLGYQGKVSIHMTFNEWLRLPEQALYLKRLKALDNLNISSQDLGFYE